MQRNVEVIKGRIQIPNHGHETIKNRREQETIVDKIVDSKPMLDKQRRKPSKIKNRNHIEVGSLIVDL